jgi:adenylate cyclase
MEKRLPRKLAAILYADVAGYSRLTGEDEDATHRALSEYLDLISNTIESHGGKVMHYAGDAVLAKFEAVVDTMSAAIEIQNNLHARNEDLPRERRVEFRVGVNLGDVIEDRGDIYGDGVNVAARLESLADPGGICISDAVRTAAGNKLALDYEDMGEQEVKNIEDPVRAYKVMMSAREESKTEEAEKRGLELPDKPSIAVLPFTNMSGDPEQEYFSDGITEDIITELSRFPVLFVIARHSSFAFKGKKLDIQEVGQKLGVQFVIEGSVRRARDRVRITAQLIDVETSNHVWADRYDRSSEDIFDVQDEVTRAIVMTLAGQLEKSVSERSRRKRTESMTAYDCVLRGNQHFHRYSSDDLLEARNLYQKAIELDPQFAQAHSRLAGVHNSLVFRGRETDENSDQTMEVVQRALSLDSNDGFSRTTLGWALLRRGSFEEAEEQLEKALALNPNDADTVAWAAHGLALAGNAEKAYDLISKAIRLNPLHPDIYHSHLANAAFFTGRYEQAIREYKRGLSLGAGYHFALAATYGQMGQLEEARAEAAKYVEQQRKQLQSRNTPAPTSDMEMAMERVRRFGRKVDRERLIDGLRKAGLADQPAGRSGP